MRLVDLVRAASNATVFSMGYYSDASRTLLRLQSLHVADGVADAPTCGSQEVARRTKRGCGLCWAAAWLRSRSVRSRIMRHAKLYRSPRTLDLPSHPLGPPARCCTIVIP
eukprot:5801868-Prymnesium_polylepis.1